MNSPNISFTIICLFILASSVAIMGCVGNEPQAPFEKPVIGSVINRDSIITVQEKWRVFEGECFNSTSLLHLFNQKICGYSYHARLTNGQVYRVNPSIYEELPIYQTGIGRGPSLMGFPYSIEEFYPVNITSYSDVKNQVTVIP